jgi:hypothetical protein
MERGADVNAADTYLRRTPLHFLCDFADCARADEGYAVARVIGEMLIQAGAATDARDREGRLPEDYVKDVYAAGFADWLRSKAKTAVKVRDNSRKPPRTRSSK